MKRFHIHVGVEDLARSVQFYSTLFGQEPAKRKSDYAKWMLDDPRVNFAISTKSGTKGVDHLGIQVETGDELDEITTRLKDADLTLSDVGVSTCCYAKSNKAWVSDPSGVAWETYQTMADVEVYSESKAPSTERCCASTEPGNKCC